MDIRMTFARAHAKHRCTVETFADSGTDVYYVPTHSDSATTYDENVPCLWWQEIGTGEIIETDREAVMNVSRMLIFPSSGKTVTEQMRVTNIKDRLGTVIDSGPWGIQAIAPRHAQGGYLLLLERVS
jgi:hypothetical protein